MPRGRGASAVPRRRYQPGRPVRQRRRRNRLDQVLPPPGLGRCRRQDRHRAARHGAGQGQRRAGTARADGRAQAVHARELHDRRHDREQLVRLHRAGVRQNGRLGAAAGGADLRRAAHLGRRDQRGGVRADRRGRRRQGGAVPAAARDPRHLPGRDPHRLPEDPAPGVRVQPRPVASRERVPRGQGSCRQREHLGDRAACRARAVRGAALPVPGRARVPRHRRRRRSGAEGDRPQAVAL